ncbi:histidine phosphatase family protein [Thermosulfurimonas marina]|uniref:Histidine phosphatase family protein n=1 Tax=Thermosulfurimonas marina TaxID=2047767 RepID=A0A6H1WTZ5_9BACT|nr:histidine phosphatase family protein [Thermosulfurimonas marina]QJA06658.1 histidine phosphatase family protein [Thermosulfurimonas marina]
MKSSNPLLVLLLRHEETLNPEGRLYGQEEVSLSETGRRRTEALVERLCRFPVRAVYGSDLSRSAYGAQRLAALTGAPLRLTPDLREIDFGAWTGRTFAELLKIPEFRLRLSDPEALAPPGGETLAELAQRALGVLTEIRREFSSGLVVIFGHGGLNRALLCRLLELPLRRFFSLEQRPGAVNLLVFYPEASPLLALFNAPSDLDLGPYLDYYGIGAHPYRRP